MLGAEVCSISRRSPAAAPQPALLVVLRVDRLGVRDADGVVKQMLRVEGAELKVTGDNLVRREDTRAVGVARELVVFSCNLCQYSIEGVLMACRLLLILETPFVLHNFIYGSLTT